MLLESGAQPLISDDGKYILAVNGEIYNHVQLRAEIPSYKFKTHSDCEIIIPLVCSLSFLRLFSPVLTPEISSTGNMGRNSVAC